MDIITIQPTKENTRKMLIVAAAQTLCLAPHLSRELAGVDTAKFVASARQAFKGAGFAFSDDDMREIHRLVRNDVAKRAAQGEMPVLDRMPGGQWVPRPANVVEITEPGGRRYTVDKDRKVF